MAVSIAELFATLGLDDSDFHAKLQQAKVGMVTAAEDMALPIGKTKTLLRQLRDELGPTAKAELLVQLKEQGYELRESARLAKQAIDELRAAERQRAVAMANITAQVVADEKRQQQANREHMQERKAATADAVARQREMFDRMKAEAMEALRVEQDAAAKREAAMRRIEQSAIAQIQSKMAAEKDWQTYINQQHTEALAEDRRRTEAARQNSHAIAEARDVEVQALRRLSQTMFDLGRVGLMVFTPIAAELVVAGKAFSDFDNALTQSLSILGEVDAGLREQLGNTVRELSTQFPFAAKAIAASIYEIGSAGYSAEQALGILPITTKFAAAGLFEVNEAAKILTSTQAALGLRVEDATQNMANMARVGNVLTKADTLAAGTTRQFAEALFNSASTMRQLNVPLEEGVAVLAAFARQGIHGKEAGTQLGIVLRDLSTKAITNAEDWKKLGVEVYNTQTRAFNPMVNIIQQMDKAFEGLSAKDVRIALMQTGIQQRSMRFLLTLKDMGQQLGVFNSQLTNTGDVMGDIAERRVQSFEKQLTLLKNKITDIQISIGKELVAALGEYMPLANAAADTTKSLVERFGEMPKGIKETAAGLVIGATAIGEFGSAAVIAASYVVRLIADLKTLEATAKAVAALKILGVGGLGVAAGLIGTGAIHNATTDAQVRSAAGTAELGGVGSDLEDAIEEQANDRAHLLAEAGFLMRDLGKIQAPNLVQMQKEMAALQAAIAATNKTTLDGRDAWDDYGESSGKAAKKLKAELTENEAAYRKFLSSQKELNDETAGYNELLEEFGVKVSDPKIALWEEMLEKLAVGVIYGKVSLVDFNNALAEFNRRVNEIDFSKFEADRFKLDSKFIGISEKELGARFAPGTEGAKLMKAAVDALNAALMGTGQLTKAQSDAFNRMGIKTSQDLEKLAEQARNDYTLIAESGKASADGILRAWVKMHEAQMDAGREYSAFQMFVIAEVARQSESGANRIRNVMKDLSREIDRLTRQLAGDLVDGLFSLFDTSKNDKIKEDIESLRTEIADASADWIQAQQEAADAIAKIDTELAESISKASEERNKSLEEGAREYAAFVRDVNRRRAEITREHSQALARETREVRQSLEEQIAEYRRASAEIIEASYRDRRDAEIEYRRFVEDSQREIAKALQEGDMERAEAARLELQRRTEDHRRYLADEAEDTRKALAEKARLEQEAQAAAAQRIRDITTAHREAQAEELSDLEDSLADRSAQYAAFQEEVEATFRAAVQAAREQAAEATRAVAEQLAEQRRQYEQRISEANQQIKALEDQFQSTFERIAEMFEELMMNFGKSLAKFVATEFFEGVVNSIGNAVTRKLAGALGIPLPGGGGGAPVQLPDLSDIPGGNVRLPPIGGGGGGVPGGGGAGGALGAIDIASGVVSAAAAVYANIQMRRMEQDLGRIEVTSREIKAEITNLRNDEWIRHNEILFKWDDFERFRRQQTADIITLLNLIYENGGTGGGGGSGERRSFTPTQLAPTLLDSAASSQAIQQANDAVQNSITSQQRYNQSLQNLSSATSSHSSSTAGGTQALVDFSESVGDAVSALEVLSFRANLQQDRAALTYQMRLLESEFGTALNDAGPARDAYLAAQRQRDNLDRISASLPPIVQPPRPPAINQSAGPSGAGQYMWDSRAGRWLVANSEGVFVPAGPDLFRGGQDSPSGYLNPNSDPSRQDIRDAIAQTSMSYQAARTQIWEQFWDGQMSETQRQDALQSLDRSWEQYLQRVDPNGQTGNPFTGGGGGVPIWMRPNSGGNGPQTFSGPASVGSLGSTHINLYVNPDADAQAVAVLGALEDRGLNLN